MVDTMRVFLHPDLTGRSGRASGYVSFGRGANRSFVRQFTMPVDPSTTFQVRTRYAFGRSARAWSSATASQKDAWKAYAALYFDEVPDGYGGTTAWSGYLLFCVVQWHRLSAGLLVSAVPPEVAPPSADDWYHLYIDLDGDRMTAMRTYITASGKIRLRMTPARPHGAEVSPGLYRSPFLIPGTYSWYQDYPGLEPNFRWDFNEAQMTQDFVEMLDMPSDTNWGIEVLRLNLAFVPAVSGPVKRIMSDADITIGAPP